MIENKLFKLTLITLGSLFLFLGVLGVFLPLLPTTPFLLITAACYLRSSEKLYYSLMNNRFLGRHIRNYYEGKGVPLHIKIIACGSLWLTMGYSILFIISNPVIKFILLLVALCVTIHLFLIRTLRKEEF